MRSITLSLALVSLIAGSAPAAARWTGALGPQGRCPDQPTAHLARPGKSALHKKLTDLPPGDAFLAVYRRDANGCVVPVKVTFRPKAPGRQSPTRLPRQH